MGRVMRIPWIEDLRCTRSSQRSRFLVLTKRSPAFGNENGKGFSVLHILFVTYGDVMLSILSHTSFGKSLSPPSELAILAKTSQALWKRSKLAKKLGMIEPGAQDYGQMSLISEANTDDRNVTQYSSMILTSWSDNGHIWQNLTGRGQSLCYSLL